MTRVLLLLAAVAALFGGWWMMRSPDPGWTTTSGDALDAFEDGVVALNKYYPEEAVEHFRRALELDPEFAMAKLKLAMTLGRSDERERLYEELGRTDLSRLTERERFLIEYRLLTRGGRIEEAEALLAWQLKKTPSDPFVLFEKAMVSWDRGDWPVAETTYAQLLEVDPNWAVAQNHLGYIAMGRGKFEEAEEHFLTYQFIAPHQPNPHDSLGELYTLLGRHDEAREQLHEALAIKPDFCPSYGHLIDLGVAAGDLSAADDVLEGMRANCGEETTWYVRCKIELWRHYQSGRLEAPWSEDYERCRQAPGEVNLLMHRFEVSTGRLDAARQREEQLRGFLDKRAGRDDLDTLFLHAVYDHLRGVRLAGEGDVDGAIAAFKSSHSSSYYWGDGRGMLKLFNLLNLARAQELAGRTKESRKTLRLVKEVNPTFAEGIDDLRLPCDCR